MKSLNAISPSYNSCFLITSKFDNKLYVPGIFRITLSKSFYKGNMLLLIIVTTPIAYLFCLTIHLVHHYILRDEFPPYGDLGTPYSLNENWWPGSDPYKVAIILYCFLSNNKQIKCFQICYEKSKHVVIPHKAALILYCFLLIYFLK